MPMSPAHLQKAVAHVNAKGLSKCKHCGTNVTLFDELQCLAAYDKSGPSIDTGQLTILITTYCTNCGIAQLVNARVAGIT